jgi:biopolymer transport protein ExbB
MELCQRNKAPISDILKAGLLRIGRPMPEVEKSMEDAALREMASQRARIRPLSVVADVAPLIGLLGTVVGMLDAFRTASQEGLGKAETLAEGIYLALETTVAGLIIAIPAMLFAALFVARLERYMRETDEQLMEVMPVLGRMQLTGSDAAAPRSAPANNPLMAGR